MNNQREAPPLYHDNNYTVSLGCTLCPDREPCGGLQTSDALFDCSDFCCGNGNSADHSDCQFVCRQNVEDYINRHIEVGGWSFDNIPRSNVLAYSKLPSVIPLLYGR